MNISCLDCGKTVHKSYMYKGRCTNCARVREQRRNADPKRKAYSDPAYRSIPIGGVCWVCGESGADTRDHVIPLSEGGTNDPSNIRPAHRKCNSGRRTQRYCNRGHDTWVVGRRNRGCVECTNASKRVAQPRLPNMVCRNGHDKTVTGYYRDGRCKECAKSNKNSFYARNPQYARDWMREKRKSSES